jgi:phosphoribosylformimino-5-aminoimidazole carboxamide ribotide isomerase
MKIIPVIDILSGQAVSAYRGERDSYQPLQSMLCQGSEPAAVLRGFLDFYPFTAVYLADLDALLGRGDNNSVINRLTEDFPSVQLWLDNGNRGGVFNNSDHIHPVLGTETGLSADSLVSAVNDNPDTVLSLDFNESGLLGDASLLNQPRFWPQRCILMALGRVGTGAGPDTVLLKSFRAMAPGKAFYAAGGIRNERDLRALVDAGAAGVLVATALHKGRITRANLEAFNG